MVDEDAAHRTSSCLRLSALIADGDRRNVFVKKLALAMFPDGSVDKEHSIGTRRWALGHILAGSAVLTSIPPSHFYLT